MKKLFLLALISLVSVLTFAKIQCDNHFSDEIFQQAYQNGGGKFVFTCQKDTIFVSLYNNGQLLGTVYASFSNNAGSMCIEAVKVKEGFVGMKMPTMMFKYDSKTKSMVLNDKAVYVAVAEDGLQGEPYFAKHYNLPMLHKQAGICVQDTILKSKMLPNASYHYVGTVDQKDTTDAEFKTLTVKFTNDKTNNYLVVNKADGSILDSLVIGYGMSTAISTYEYNHPKEETPTEVKYIDGVVRINAVADSMFIGNGLYVSDSKQIERTISADIIEKNASFPGGEMECMKFLRDHIKYPSKCQEKRIQGRVIVTFVVNRDGTLAPADIKVLRSPNDLLSQEAVRVVKMMPKWTPACIGKYKLRSKFNLPVMFRLG